MKLKKILVPVDGSDFSLRAAAYAVEMAKVMESEIMLMHCHKSFPVVLGEPYFQNAINKILKKSNELLEPYRKFCRMPGWLMQIEFLKVPPPRQFVTQPKSKKQT
jgi:hypothetical protein